MDCIRRATLGDVSRIAEILVFTKRMNYRSIFQDDAYSFGKMQVLTVAAEYQYSPELLQEIWVYDDGIVKGLIQISDREVKMLYVDHFFGGCGIGGKLLDFAVSQFNTCFLWVLEKNTRARSFYERHGFSFYGEWKYEEGTPEHLLKLER